jgi:hypothetical protein
MEAAKSPYRRIAGKKAKVEERRGVRTGVGRAARPPAQP